MRKILPIFLLIILSLNFIAAAPPVTTIQSTNNGLILDNHPTTSEYKEGVSAEITVHVFNISTGMRVNSSLTCFLHMYDKVGNHLVHLQTKTPAHNFDYEFLILGGNFTPATVSYEVQCENVALNYGGYLPQAIIVTDNGFEIPYQFYYIIFVLALALVVLGLWIKDPTITILGSFTITFVGLYTLFYGIVGINDPNYTRPLGIIITMLGAYISIKSSHEYITSTEL